MPTELPAPRVDARVHRDRLCESAQDQIRAYILSHSLKPGDPLPPEGELAQSLGMSRNSVREAVKSLEALGILDVRQGSGLFVRGFSFDSILDNLPYGMISDARELSDLLEVRAYLEHATVERVMRMASAEQLAGLRSSLDRMRRAAESGTYSADEDRAFHQCLYEDVDNRILVKIMDIFWVVLQRVQDQNQIPSPADPMETYRRHAKIVEALENRDVHAMRAAVHRQHIGIEGRLKEFNRQRSLAQ